jgi:branched-chain amino acid transport system permease protein
MAGLEPAAFHASNLTAPTESGALAADAFLRARDDLRAVECLPWLAAAAVPVLFPQECAFGTQVLIMMLFALSLDFILGYAGIVTLGHAAYFGLGAYAAGLLSARLGWHEPISGLLAAGLVGAVAGAVSGAILLRYRDLTLLMLTLAFSTTLYELANTWSNITGGYDGLIGIRMDPLLGVFDWDLSGVTSYCYALACLLLCFLVLRRITVSPFGQALRGIRENKARMQAIGTPVLGHLTLAYTISAALAGIAGGLLAQANTFLTMQVLSFDNSAAVLTMLVLGGTGRLYGALLGALVYTLAADRLARFSPEYWEFGVGVLLVLVVLFCPGGVFGIIDQLRRGGRRRGP